jgi:hypothetical protein
VPERIPLSTSCLITISARGAARAELASGLIRADGLPYRDERIERGHRVFDLPTAVIGHDDPVHAGLERPRASSGAARP